MPLHFTVAAAGKQYDDPSVGWKRELVEEFGASHGRAYDPGQRMSQVGGRDAARFEEFQLEREDAQQPVDSFAHDADASRAPGPGLGGDQVDDRDPQFFEFFG